MLAVRRPETVQLANIGQASEPTILARVGVGCTVAQLRFKAGGARRFGVQAFGIYCLILGLTSAYAGSKNHKTMTSIESKS
jgi:hypothetical protein